MKEITQLLRFRKQKITHLPPSQINKFIKACETTRNSLRNKTIISLSFTYGLRTSEVSNLQWGHIDFLEKKILFKRVKGSEHTILDLTKQNFSFLSQLEKRAKKITRAEDEDFVILSENKTRMDDQSILDMIETVRKKAHFPYRIRQHLFKHSSATFLRNEGWSEEQIQKYFGHKNVSNTKMYIHNKEEDCSSSFR